PTSKFSPEVIAVLLTQPHGGSKHRAGGDQFTANVVDHGGVFWRVQVPTRHDAELRDRIPKQLARARIDFNENRGVEVRNEHRVRSTLSERLEADLNVA